MQFNKQSAQELLSLRHRMQLATESAGIGVWTWNITTQALEWDDQMFRLYGVKKETFSGAYDAWRNGLHPDDLKRSEAELQSAVRGEKKFNTTFRVIWPNGEVHHIRAHGSVRNGDDGQPYEMVGLNWDITTEVIAQQRVLELSSIVRDANEAIIAQTTTGIITSWNAGAQDLYGYSAEEIVGKSVRTIVPKDADDVDALLTRVVAGERIPKYETVRLHKDGSRVNVSLVLSPIKSDTGAITGVSVIAQDITRRKRAEDMLRENASMLSLALDGAQTGALDIDLVTNIAKRSLRHDQIFGYSCLQPRWNTTIFIQHVFPDDRELARRKFAEAMKSGTLALECRIVWSDGSVHWIAVRGKLTYDAVRKPIRMLGTVNDITAQKDQEDELQKYRLAVENSTDAIIITDTSTRILYVNDSWVRMNGYGQEEAYGRKAEILKSGKTDEGVYCDIRVAMKERRSFHSDDFINCRKDGSEYCASITTYPILADDGQAVRYWVGILRDVTEEKKADQAKTEFVTLASHQLRTPLTAMRWSLEMLKEQTSHCTATEINLMNRTYTAMLNMTETINTMLAVAKIDAQKVVIKHSNFSLKSLLSSITQERAFDAEQRGVRLVLEQSLDVSIDSDANLLREIFSNLISNAIQYTQKGGVVTVRATQDAEHIVVAVEDTGIGIPRHEQDKLFMKLFRAENAKKHQTSGSGLGLYIVKSLCTLLGGTVTMKSEEGRGTVFTVRLPSKHSA